MGFGMNVACTFARSAISLQLETQRDAHAVDDDHALDALGMLPQRDLLDDELREHHPVGDRQGVAVLEVDLVLARRHLVV